MANNCNIIRDSKGTVVSTEATNGARSLLFDSLVNKLQEPSEALRVWLVSKTKDFNEFVMNPIRRKGNIKSEKIKSPIRIQNAELNFAPRVNPFTGERTGELELTLVKTNPQDRGQGLAKQAIGKFLDYADTIGMPTYLTVSPREAGVSEEGLIKLYESFGYSQEESLFEMTRPVGNRELPEVLEGLDENGEIKMEPLLNYIDNRSATAEIVDTPIVEARMAKKLQDLYTIPEPPPNKKDKVGRIVEGRVHLYHSTNGLSNLENIRKEGLNFNKQKAVEGLLFSKLGAPYRQADSFVIIETDVSNINWSERFDGQEVALGKLDEYRIVHTSEFSPEDIKAFKSLETILKRNGLKNLEEAIVNYSKYNGGNPVTIAVEKALKEVKGQLPSINKLTKTEIAEYKEVMMGMRVQSTTDLIEKLKDGFMPDGYFNPDRVSLSSTNLYNGEEITDILTSTSLQENIRDFIYTLNNINEEVLNDIYTDENFLVVKDGTKNGIGKFKLDNPYIIEKRAIKVLGGITTRAEFEDIIFNNEEVSLLATPYLETQGTKEDLYQKFKIFKRVAVIEIEDEAISVKLNNTREVLDQVLIEPETTQLEDNLEYLIELDAEVYEDNPESVGKLINEVSKEMMNIGLDTTELKDSLQGKSVGEFKDFLNAVSTFITTETDQAFDNLVGAYNEFFEVNDDFKFNSIPLAENIGTDNSFYLEAQESNISLFNSNGLIPIGENVYKRISKTTPLEQVYDSVYINTITNGYNSILSDEALRPSGYDSEGSLDLSKVTDPNNKKAIIRDMRAFIQEQIAGIYVGEENISQDDLERYVLMFNYINRTSDLNKFDNTPVIDTEYATFLQEINNQNYLQTDFIADFNKKMLKAKSNKSVEYDEFYSNFEITNLGIKLANTDPISLSKINKYLEDNTNLVSYMRLHKQGVDLDPIKIVDPIRDDLFMRNFYVNFPKSVKVFKGDYNVLSKKTILADTKEPFIRIKEGVYEVITGIGSKGVYGKLAVQNGVFKVYNTSLTPPTLDIDISELSAIDANIITDVELTNLYSEEEKDQINNEHDNC